MYPATWEQYQTLLLALAWFAGFGWGLRKGWSWERCLGLALVAYPFAKLTVGVWLSFGAIFEGGVAPPLSIAELWSKVLWHTFWYIVVPAVGLALVYERVPSFARGPPRPGLLQGNGLAPTRSNREDVLAGSSLFFPLAFAYFFATALVASAIGRFVNTGDDSAVFDNVTPLVVLVLSIVAGVSEEFLFRGLLQTRLSKAMPFWAANTVQAVFFGLVHSGYGNLAHVLGPLLFGFALGLVAKRLGILAAIALHAQIDVLALGLSNVTVPVAFLFGALVTMSLYGLLLYKHGPALRLLRGERAPVEAVASVAAVAPRER